jgi:hypothetical protein
LGQEGEERRTSKLLDGSAERLFRNYADRSLVNHDQHTDKWFCTGNGRVKKRANREYSTWHADLAVNVCV